MNNYYTHGSYPATGAFGASAGLRSELDAVTAGFDLLPTITGNGGKILAVNAGATALEAITTTGTGSGVRATSPTLVTPVLGVATVTSVNKVAITAPATAATLALADGSTLATAGAFAQTLTATGATNVTLPTTGTLATLAGAEVLTNKTINLASNTLVATSAQIAAAVTDESGTGSLIFASALQDQTHTAFTTAGTSTAYTLTPSPAITAYAANQSFFVNFNAASGAAPTLAISGIATPPNLVKQIGDGTYANIAAGDIPINHRSRVTLLSATQALVEDLPAPAQTLNSGTAQASTSGTSIDFTGIPAWVKRVTINLNAVSTNGTSNPIFQIGDSGGIETSGYIGTGGTIDNAVSPATINFTTGFGLPLGAAGNSISGSIIFNLIDAANFIWCAIGTFGLNSSATLALTSGSKALTATLDRVRITTVGGVNTFDAGIINILYE